jgi:glycosyltransferase involved in cell wall biosynthesis
MHLVLVVPGGVDPPGGPRVIPFVHHLVRDLSAEHRVKVIAVGHGSEATSWRLFDADVVNVPIGRRSKADIARVVRTVSRLAAEGGKPDVIHGLWANLPGFAAALAAKRHRVPSVISVCGGEFAALADIAYGGGLSRGPLLMARTATRLATAATAATSWMSEHVAANGGRVDELIPLGADLATFHATSRATSAVSGGQRLVHIANINRVKDQALLLRAFQIVLGTVESATLDIVGADTLDGEMQCLAASLGIADRVCFTGYLPPPSLAAMLHSSLLHVLSSRHDAGPVAVLEAAACGVATVGTMVGHVADFAAMSPPAAVAVADGRPDALAAAIGALLGDDPRRRAIAGRAEAWATAHDSAHTSRSFEALYRRLSASR